MSSEFAIGLYGADLQALQHGCEEVLTRANPDRELVYGRIDAHVPADSEWKLLEGETQVDPALEVTTREWQAHVIAAHEEDEGKIAAAQHIADLHLGGLINPTEPNPEHRMHHVVDRVTTKLISIYEHGGHVGISEIYDQHGNEYSTVTDIGIDMASSLLQARITSTGNEITDVSFVSLGANALEVIDRCEQVFGPNSHAAILLEGRFFRPLAYELSIIRDGAEGLIPADELDPLLEKVRAIAANAQQEMNTVSGVNQDRLDRLAEFLLSVREDLE